MKGVNAIFGPPLSNSVSPRPFVTPPGMSPLQSPRPYAQYLTSIGGNSYQQTPYVQYPQYAQGAKLAELSHGNYQTTYRGGHQKRNSESEGM